MDARYAFLIVLAVAGFWASQETESGYSEAWMLIGVLASVSVLVIWWRNRRRGPGKHS